MLTEDTKLKIEDVMRTEGKYVGPTSGISMLPMLKTGRDSIVVYPNKDRLKRLDVALYKRGNDYVLHRVIKVVDGGYIIRGDNCYTDEQIPEENILGVLTEYFRKNKLIKCTDKKYLKYAERRVKTYRIRRVFVVNYRRLKSLIRRIYRVIFRKKDKAINKK